MGLLRFPLLLQQRLESMPKASARREQQVATGSRFSKFFNYTEEHLIYCRMSWMFQQSDLVLPSVYLQEQKMSRADRQRFVLYSIYIQAIMLQNILGTKKMNIFKTSISRIQAQNFFLNSIK